MRFLTSDDAEHLSTIDLSLFDNGFNERTIRIELELGQGWGIGNPLFAYILVRSDPYISDIIRLGVMPSQQGKGYGRSLLRAALNLTAGPHMLTVRKNNKKAIELYKKYDFRIVATSERSWLMLRSEGN